MSRNSEIYNKVSGFLRLKIMDTHGTWFLGRLHETSWLSSSPPESELKLSYWCARARACACACVYVCVYLLLEVFINNAAVSRDGKLTCIIN